MRPRGPGIVFTSLSVTVLLILGFVALNASQSSPPTVAEFAPAALDQIKKAPDRQKSDSGDDKGVVAGGHPTKTPTATATPTPEPTPSGPVVPLTHQCPSVTQIEDPQSPPCVPGWVGNNGGSTWQGVTKTEIKVAAPYGTFLTGDPTPVWQAMVKFFNAKFEFYGRHITLQPYLANGDNFATPDAAQMTRDASHVADDLKSFASLGYPDRKGAEHIYYNFLSGKKVLSIIGRETALGTEAYLAKRAPYQWNRGTAIDTQMKNYGQFVCNGWAGKPLRYGGPVWPFTPAPTGRSFGVIVNSATDGTTPDINPMLENLKVCNVKPYVYTVQEALSDSDGTAPLAAMAQKKVTTIICVCDVGSARYYLEGAEGNGYHPEWLMGTYLNTDLDNSFANSPNTQTDNVFGMSYSDKILPIQDSWWYQAMHEGDPNVATPTNCGPLATYQQLLLLASGIQAAGPKLTPQTFSDGLHRTIFPNPRAGKAPYYQGTVGFPNGQHSWHLDASTFWYDVNQTNTDDPTTRGRVCLVGHGLRWKYGEWPKKEPAYKATPCT